MNHSYSAITQADGSVVVYGVPIFVECERERANGEVFQFDREWIAVAVHKAKQAEAEGYLPPMHIRHHDDANDKVLPAGFFRITGTTEIRFKGAMRLAIVADLHLTDGYAKESVVAKRLPYRSVEIFNVNEPAINSLALLDHEPPFLELPMLMVTGIGPVASATFKARTSGKRDEQASVTSTLFDANGVHFKDAPMDEQDKPKPDAETEDKPEVEAMAQDDKPEGEQDGISPEMQALFDRIDAGAITVAEYEGLVERIKARNAQPAEEQTMEDEKPNQVDGPAPVDERMQALATENEVLRAKIAALENEKATEADVGEAMSKLAGRPLGSDIRDRLTTFRRQYGKEAFSAHVASLEAVAAPADKPSKAEKFASVGGGEQFSAEVMAYSNKGADAVERAQQFSKQWQQLKAKNATRMSEARYIEVNMAGIVSA